MDIPISTYLPLYLKADKRECLVFTFFYLWGGGWARRTYSIYKIYLFIYNQFQFVEYGSSQLPLAWFESEASGPESPPQEKFYYVPSITVKFVIIKTLVPLPNMKYIVKS
jgi:hypothetical protein